MKNIIKLREGDKIPDGAKFLNVSKEQELVGHKEVLVHSGWISNTVALVGVYEEKTYLYFEVEL